MALKVVMFFNSYDRGWTETYYATGSSPIAYAAQYLTLANLTPFISWRAADVTFYEVRISLIGSPRVTYSIVQGQLPQPQGVYGPTQPEGPADDALVLLRSTVGISRHLWLRGLQASMVQYATDGTDNPPALLLSTIASIVSGMQQCQLCIQNATIPLPNSGLWTQVASAAPSAGGPTNTTLTVAPASTLTPPYPALYFQGIPRNQMPGFPRTLIPIAVAGGNVIVPWTYRSSTDPYVPPKLKYCTLTDTYNAINNGSFVKYGIRKTGRPFGVPRGRTPVTIKRQ